MSEDKTFVKSMMDPRFLISVLAIAGAFYGQWVLNDYKMTEMRDDITELKEKVKPVDGMAKTLTSIKVLVVKIAEKQGIEVIIP